MSLQSDIAMWDGKSVADIGNVYLQHSGHKSFQTEILQLMGTSEHQKGASWLLKKYLESGGKLDPKQIKHVYCSLDRLTYWESKLHMLQIMAFMRISKAEKHKVECFLRDCLMDSNKFVRAWTYNAWHLLAQQFPEYQKEVDLFFEMAMRDEAPSVRSRIRNILKHT